MAQQITAQTTLQTGDAIGIRGTYNRVYIAVVQELTRPSGEPTLSFRYINNQVEDAEPVWSLISQEAALLQETDLAPRDLKAVQDWRQKLSCCKCGWAGIAAQGDCSEHDNDIWCPKCGMQLT
jgi:predicted RNA-binding Zn-ribbon protein involved in translation (DUF1610 family)